MVGPTSKQLEPSEHASVKTPAVTQQNNSKLLSKQIPKTQNEKNKKPNLKIPLLKNTVNENQSLETPKILEHNLNFLPQKNSQEHNLKNSPLSKMQDLNLKLNASEMFAPPLDVSEDCITIIVSDESTIPISEATCEISESTNLKDFVSNYTVIDDDEYCYKSPKIEKALSDYGYESTGSPHSESCDQDMSEMSELWNQSVTELFPTLM